MRHCYSGVVISATVEGFLRILRPGGPESYKFIGFGDSRGPKPHKFIGFGDSHGPDPIKL